MIMTDNYKIFPVTITKIKDKSDYPYLVKIPDLDGMTEGKSVADAIKMAEDYIGTASLEEKLPKSNTKVPNSKKGVIVTLVAVNVIEYKRKHDNKTVKKTLTIPSYLNEFGKENNINFSKLLTEALREKLNR